MFSRQKRKYIIERNQGLKERKWMIVIKLYFIVYWINSFLFLVHFILFRKKYASLTLSTLVTLENTIYIRIHEETGWYRRVAGRHRRIHEDTGWYRRIYKDTWGYRRIQDDTGGYIRIHKDTGGYRRKQKNTGENRRIQEDIWEYRRYKVPTKLRRIPFFCLFLLFFLS